MIKWSEQTLLAVGNFCSIGQLPKMNWPQGLCLRGLCDWNLEEKEPDVLLFHSQVPRQLSGLLHDVSKEM